MGGKTMRRLGLMMVLAGMMAFGVCGLGCGKPSELEGQWVDVNGGTTLEIRGGTMTVRHGQWSESYGFRTKTEDGRTVLLNDDFGGDRGFGVMTELTVRPDGSITGNERILDGEGHSYRFVRPEALEQELAIRDLSREAPREIHSREIRQFSLVFHNRGGSYGLSQRWPQGMYSWEIGAVEGGWMMTFHVAGPSCVVMDYRGTVSADYVEGLAGLLTDLDIPAHNGYYRTNNVHRPGWLLAVEYASGEELTVRAGGTASEQCVFDIPALLEYADRQPLPPPY